MTLGPAQRRQLLALARTSIESALPHGDLAPQPPAEWTPELLALRSSFVTLRIDRELRGCCGTLDAPRPLAEDVWRNAWASGFRDPRFAPLTPHEWLRSELQISVLTPAAPMYVASEQDLLAELRPGVDGLILVLGASRVTFLPAVWDQIADPQIFVRQLKLKAGWRADFWSPHIRVSRYESESFGEEDG
jgi:AmmeMemoRadiSam system protein A